MKRLSTATQPRLPKAVKRPASAERPQGGIVHLGLGAFARAHLAEYTQDANEHGESWGITGVSLQRPDMRDALKLQDGLYTLAVRAPDGPRYRIIDTVRDVLVAPENRGAVIARLADPATRIVSLTVTEKGYCHDPATGRLRETHPDIVHDLENPRAPRSAIGFLVAGLALRRDAGLKPYTVMCCDNLPSNGHVLRGLVLAFAGLRDEKLAAWIAAEGAFPCTMVDRIVPATTAVDIAETENALGLHDAAPVMAEPFRQWVIEDRFVMGRPAWEKAGAQLVVDVEPFEFMKLRMLNGAHSTLAYLGYLAGYETVAEASADPVLARMLEELWARIIPTVPVPPGVDLVVYAAELLQRFRNPAIRHRTWQIAMDGSQKLPQRLLGTIRDRLAKGQSIDALALGVAGWMRYVMGVDEKFAAIEVKDPLSAEFKSRVDAAGGNPAAVIDGLLGIKAIFGDDLPQNTAFRAALVQNLEAFLQNGVLATLRSRQTA
jgi:fructuronate reductase